MRFLGPTTEFEGSVVRPHDLDVFSMAVRDAVRAEVTDVQRVGHEVRLTAVGGDCGPRKPALR